MSTDTPHTTNDEDVSDHLRHIRALLPDYETDHHAIGTNREVDPDLDDPRPWHEVHGLTTTQADALITEHGGVT